MFTSRAEYRLLLRADNADQRLTALGVEIGLVGETRREASCAKMAKFRGAKTLAKSLEATPPELLKSGIRINQDGVRRSVMDLLAYPKMTMADLTGVWPELSDLDAETAEYLETDATYASYLKRQEKDIAAFQRDEGLRIPESLDFTEIGGLSNEVRQKLSEHRPATLGQAARIEGVTPGALMAVLAHIKKLQRAA